MLRDTFRAYLEAPADRRRVPALTEALATGGRGTLARLLVRHGDRGAGWHPIEGGPWAGREAFVGPRPPDATAGALWLDTYELTLSVLLPEVTDLAELAPDARARALPTRGWMSLTPVERWQFGAFVDVAVPVPMRDLRQLTSRPETDAIDALRCSEASAYLHWFGKRFPGKQEWIAAGRALGQAPWATPAKEWAGTSYLDDELAVALSPATIDVDLRRVLDETDPERRMLYEAFETPSGIGFRSLVPTAYGLALDDVPLTAGEVQLSRRLRRPAA